MATHVFPDKPHLSTWSSQHILAGGPTPAALPCPPARQPARQPLPSWYTVSSYSWIRGPYFSARTVRDSARMHACRGKQWRDWRHSHEPIWYWACVTAPGSLAMMISEMCIEPGSAVGQLLLLWEAPKDSREFRDPCDAHRGSGSGASRYRRLLPILQVIFSVFPLANVTWGGCSLSRKWWVKPSN